MYILCKVKKNKHLLLMKHIYHWTLISELTYVSFVLISNITSLLFYTERIYYHPAIIHKIPKGTQYDFDHVQ